MKQAFVLPGLLATVLSAALPSDLVPEFTDEPFTLAQLSVEAHSNVVDGPVKSATDLELFLNSTDASDSFSVNTDGEAAWLKIQNEIRAELGEGSLSSDALHKWAGYHFSTAEAESFPPTRSGPTRPAWWPNKGSSPDFHSGIRPETVCEYLRGASWKVNDLRRPIEQFQVENVPWLIWNKGPYFYVIEGLREIEWVLLKIAYALQDATVFTFEEQRQIIRCHYEFSGFEKQLTRLTPWLPQPSIVNNPAVVDSEGLFQRRQVIDDDDEAPGTQAATPVATAAPTAAPAPDPAAPAPVPSRVPVFVRPIPWVNRFGFKPLLRLLIWKSSLSKGQAYANARIMRVLTNLEFAFDDYVNQMKAQLRHQDTYNYFNADVEYGEYTKLFRTLEEVYGSQLPALLEPYQESD